MNIEEYRVVCNRKKLYKDLNLKYNDIVSLINHFYNIKRYKNDKISSDILINIQNEKEYKIDIDNVDSLIQILEKIRDLISNKIENI